jgi:hypothetical protein
MFLAEYEPTHKMNVFDPDPKNDNLFIQKLKKRIYLLNNDTKFEIKKLLNSSK